MQNGMRFLDTQEAITNQKIVHPLEAVVNFFGLSVPSLDLVHTIYPVGEFFSPMTE
jgi:hypothetical protein